MAKRKKKKAEKKPDKSEIVDEDGDISSDDDLPAVLSPKKKMKHSFQEGDLVFAKFKKFPYWPALFYKFDGKQKRGFVYFFEQSTIDNKTTLPVPVASIKPYSCDEKDDYISIGKSRYKEDYQNGLARAYEYVQKRAMGKVPDFFAGVQEDDDDDDEEEEEEEGESSQDISTNNQQQKNNQPEEEEKIQPVRRNSIFKQDRKSKRKQRKESKPYMDWIMANGKDYLHQLMKGKIHSERHRTFFRGSQKERDGLKYISGYGPISSDEEADTLLDMLTEWHFEKFAKDSVNTITYVTDVWLPEVIIASIKSIKGCSYEEAEKVFLKEDKSS